LYIIFKYLKATKGDKSIGIEELSDDVFCKLYILSSYQIFTELILFYITLFIYLLYTYIANDTSYTKIFGQNSQSESVIYYQDPIQQFHIV